MGRPWRTRTAGWRPTPTTRAPVRPHLCCSTAWPDLWPVQQVHFTVGAPCMELLFSWSRGSANPYIAGAYPHGCQDYRPAAAPTKSCMLPALPRRAQISSPLSAAACGAQLSRHRRRWRRRC